MFWIVSVFTIGIVLYMCKIFCTALNTGAEEAEVTAGDLNVEQ